MGATTRFTIVQGQDYDTTFVLTREDTGAALDLTLLTGTHTVEVRNVPNDIPGSAIKTTGTVTVPSAAAGKVRVQFTKTQTALIIDPNWVADVRLNQATKNWRAIYSNGFNLKLRATT